MHWINHTLYIEPLKAFIDPNRPVERAIITHGHADHARAGHTHVLATSDTIEIMKRRYGPTCASVFQSLDYGEKITINGVTIELYPAGHILGSAQVLLSYKGERVVCTGDYKVRPDPTAPAFELVPCHTFITEATFGLPVFHHPKASSEIDKLLKSIIQQPERCHLIGAYALGKAQRVIRLLRDTGYERPIYLHGAQTALCDFYQQKGIYLGDLRPVAGEAKPALKGEIIIAPPSALKDKWSRRFPDPVTAFASGWMSVRQRAVQRGIELPLVISDHADWNELTEIIPATGAEQIWITHGREEALVRWCALKGLNAEPLSIQGREEIS